MEVLVTWYSLLYFLAIAGGTAIVIAEGRRRDLDMPRWAMAVMVWAIGGLVGAELPHAWLGNLAAQRTAVGAVAGATIALFVAAQLLGIPAGRAIDTTATAIPLAGALARLGCFAAECCQGIATSLPVGVLDEHGVRRHPTQLYEASFDMFVAAWISRSRTPRLEGHRFLVSLAAMSVGRFFIEFVRDSEKLGPLSLAQWVVGLVAVVCAVLVARSARIPQLRRRTSALTGATALALQLPVMGADTTYPRKYYSIGAGAAAGAYDHVTKIRSCDSPDVQEWVRHHAFSGGAVEGGVRTELSSTHGYGLRVRGFSERQRAGAAIALEGSLPADSAPYARTSSGATIAGDLDWKWFGLSLGATVGDLYIRSASGFADNELSHERVLPDIGLRIGTSAGALEARFGDEIPFAFPSPVATLAITGGTPSTRMRVGVSDAGPCIGLRLMTPQGFEFDPFLAVGFRCDYCARGRNSQGGLMVRKWVRARD
jgi:phosphatidylglycerol:prolipoprotein diacylglycerol transferase